MSSRQRATAPAVAAAPALSLEAEQAEQRKMLRALQKITLGHMRECGKLQKIQARELTNQGRAIAAIEARFVLFDRICGFLLKHGKKLGYAVITALISAYAGLLVQSWALHRDTTAHADDAASKASAATAAVPAQTVRQLEAHHVTVAP